MYAKDRVKQSVSLETSRQISRDSTISLSLHHRFKLPHYQRLHLLHLHTFLYDAFIITSACCNNHVHHHQNNMMLMIIVIAIILSMMAGTLSESVQKGREEGARLLRLKIYRHFLDNSKEKIASRNKTGTFCDVGTLRCMIIVALR